MVVRPGLRHPAARRAPLGPQPPAPVPHAAGRRFARVGPLARCWHLLGGSPGASAFWWPSETTVQITDLYQVSHHRPTLTYSIAAPPSPPPPPAAVSLFGLYLLLKFLPDLNIQSLLNAYFWLLGSVALVGAFGPTLRTAVS